MPTLAALADLRLRAGATAAAPAPAGPERDVARYGVLLFALIVCFQRFAAPFTPVSLLVPIVYAWSAYGLYTGRLQVDRERLVLWMLAAGTTAVIGPLQVLFTRSALISLGSWGLLMVTTLPAVLRLAVRTRATYDLFLRGVAKVATWFACLSIFFMVSQVALPYHDWFATIVPHPLQMPGYVYTYPIRWQSPIYRSNAWIGLEASWTAFLIGLGILAGLLSGARMWRIAVLFAGMLCTFSGSGLQLVATGVVFMLVGGRASLLKRYAWAAVALAVVGAATPMGQSIFGRVGEVGNNRSSTALRATQPYVELWPTWVVDLVTVLLGRGAGASERLANDTHIEGLLAPTATKVFMDYGLIAGLCLCVYLVAIMLRSPEPTIAVALGLSLWTLQTPTAVFIVATIVMVSVWSPQQTPRPFGRRRRPPPIQETP